MLLRLTLSGFLVVTACSAYAQTVTPDLSGKDAHWIKDEKSNCWAANPEPQAGESIIWVGPCEKGVASGEGTLIWYQDGKIAGRDEGNFKDGALIGRGRMQRSDGTSFEGSFPGRGTLTLPSGEQMQAEAVRQPAGWRFQPAQPATNNNK
jgi:hypothetical protein